MSIKRGPDGRIIESPTVAVPKTGGATGTGTPTGQSAPTAKPQSTEPAHRVAQKYDTPTVKRPSGPVPTGGSTPPNQAASGSSPRPLEERTRIIGRDEMAGDQASAASYMDDPVVGWLVVVDGPGKGACLQLGYGRNTIGRGTENRLVCDFGDGEISRKPHCVITYEPRGRIFLLQHGDGVNLTYLAGETVLEPKRLAPLSIVEIGGTQLRFVPFCGENWDWQDLSDASASDA